MPLVDLDCTARLVISPGTTVPVSTNLSFRSWEPYSVHISFSMEGRAPVNWVFARELLAEGIVRPSGLGDVRIWPEDSDRPGFLSLQLSSPYGRALLALPAGLVTPWLARTYHAVPAGFEGGSLEFDRELARLLGKAA
ncbi:SsgA family sporulation/cell division regulator [Streptomyces sp. NPDC091219]|uniref:SsgA family sporulation/cell division regulator n=1 Tax=Streptomyces sp. NPDC091219 TaxID=3155193 RepID=UPI00344C70E2